MAADAFIQFRCTPEVKTVLRALAEREQITESALVRQLVEVMLRTQIKTGGASLEELSRVSRDARLSIRLEPEDRMLLSSRATSRGMRSATYVALLVRSHLRGMTPIPKEELQAFKRCIAELSAIGRNLNQVARALNQGKGAAPGREDVRAMLKVAEGLRDHFKALLKANEQSWEQGHAETSH
jgi:hypothetical protein